jgi:hypothetical protein
MPMSGEILLPSWTRWVYITGGKLLLVVFKLLLGLFNRPLALWRFLLGSSAPQRREASHLWP